MKNWLIEAGVTVGFYLLIFLSLFVFAVMIPVEWLKEKWRGRSNSKKGKA